ncbi:MAG TPA: nitrate reductase, partial [Pseudomonas sp.]|nr:nitrate reductase [Pseudomonas sp.]
MASISRSDVGQLADLSAESAGSSASQLSPRLYSNDLAPTRAANRTWGRYSLFALWTNDVHNIANY